MTFQGGNPQCCDMKASEKDKAAKTETIISNGMLAYANIGQEGATNTQEFAVYVTNFLEENGPNDEEDVDEPFHNNAVETLSVIGYSIDSLITKGQVGRNFDVQKLFGSVHPRNTTLYAAAAALRKIRFYLDALSEYNQYYEFTKKDIVT